MAKEKDQELAVRSNEELMLQFGEITGVESRPADLDPHDLSGTEDITQDEIRLPRLAIAQGLSKQLVPTEGVFIKGLTIGEMFNDVTGEIYGNGPLTVVPLKRTVTRIEFDPNDKKVPLDTKVPAGDKRTEWTKDAEGKGVPPRATEYVEYVSLLLKQGKVPEPIMVSIKTTNKYQRAAAKLWTTFVALRGAAIYRGLYTLVSKIEKGMNKDGQETLFGVFIVKNAGFIPSDKPAGRALIEYAKGFHERLQGKTIVVNRETAEDNDGFDPEEIEQQQPAQTTQVDPGM